MGHCEINNWQKQNTVMSVLCSVDFINRKMTAIITLGGSYELTDEKNNVPWLYEYSERTIIKYSTKLPITDQQSARR